MNRFTTYFDIMACVARLSRSKPPSEAAMVSSNRQDVPPTPVRGDSVTWERHGFVFGFADC